MPQEVLTGLAGHHLPERTLAGIQQGQVLLVGREIQHCEPTLVNRRLALVGGSQSQLSVDILKDPDLS